MRLITLRKCQLLNTSSTSTCCSLHSTMAALQICDCHFLAISHCDMTNGMNLRLSKFQHTFQQLFFLSTSKVIMHRFLPQKASSCTQVFFTFTSRRSVKSQCLLNRTCGEVIMEKVALWSSWQLFVSTGDQSSKAGFKGNQLSIRLSDKEAGL